jgi:hypothetical protein
MSQSLPDLAKLIRYYILTSTTAAGSGHTHRPLRPWVPTNTGRASP